MLKITSRWLHQESIKVEWNLGKRCNYDCSYCPSVIHDNFSLHTDINILKKTVDKLAKINKPIRLSFTGGEPTVHPKFQELISYSKEKGISWISITTNGTRTFDFYKSLPVDQYVFSLHFEYDVEPIIDKMDLLARVTHKSVIGQIMAHHNYMTNVRTVRTTLNNIGIPNTVRRIRWTEGDHDLFDDMRYHPDDLEWIKEQDSTVLGNCIIDNQQIIHANDIIKLKMNQFKDWTCNIGIESLMINWDGEVHRATCRVGGSLGNVYEGTFNLPSEPVTCTRNFCTCAADIPITKILTS
jgi:MoaA/NifB/PqqE/SkfB family radical SAM enzyme